MASELAPGSRIGSYTIEEKLGRGGMGTVWRATHLGTSRGVALKVITSRLAGAPDIEERFRREARALGRLKHPHVVDVSDFGVDTIVEPHAGRVDRHFLVMELLGGRSLREELNARKKLPLAEVVDIVEQVASALDAAHQLGVVHRDLKPENVQIVPAGDGRVVVKVLDFGIAKLAGVEEVVAGMHPPSPDDGGTTPTASEAITGGSILGTPMYMAPEQIFGRPVDARSDVYALGLIAWECLAGEPPRKGAVQDILLSHVNDARLDVPRIAGVPNAARKLLVDALAREPDERPATAGTFARLLRALCAREQGIYEAASRAIEPKLWIFTAIAFLPVVPLASLAVRTLDRFGVVIAMSVAVALSWLLGGVGSVLAARWLLNKRVPFYAALLGHAGPLLVGPLHVRAPSLLGPFVVRSALSSVAAVSVFFLSMAVVCVILDVFEALARADATFVKPNDALALLALVPPLATALFAVVVMTRLLATMRAIRALVAGPGESPGAHTVRANVPGRRAPFGRGLVLAVLLFEAPFLGRPWVYAAVQLDAAWSIELAAFMRADVSPSATFHPLGTAVRRGNAHVVENLLKCGPTDVDAPDADGMTPLAMAAALTRPEQREARTEIVQLLLDYGADPERAANDGVTARDRLRAVGIELN